MISNMACEFKNEKIKFKNTVIYFNKYKYFN